jgi:hypothetical protein
VISSNGLKRRACSVMVDLGVRGFSARVGRVQAGTWAHCDYTKRELVFSRSLLLCDWVFANQIILHEVAHAEVGAAAGHTKKWLDVARAMGYRLGATVPYDAPIKGAPHKWVAVCQTGQHSAIRFERGAEDGVLGCGPCMHSGAGDVGVFWERL